MKAQSCQKRAVHTKASDWSWPLALPGTLFSQNLVLAPTQACDSAVAEQAFPNPTSHPGQLGNFCTPDHTRTYPPLATQIKSCPSV